VAFWKRFLHLLGPKQGSRLGSPQVGAFFVRAWLCAQADFFCSSGSRFSVDFSIKRSISFACSSPRSASRRSFALASSGFTCVTVGFLYGLRFFFRFNPSFDFTYLFAFRGEGERNSVTRCWRITELADFVTKSGLQPANKAQQVLAS
jgi:hypothetical protein